MSYQNDPTKDFTRPTDRFNEMDQHRRIEPREAWGTGKVILASRSDRDCVWTVLLHG